MWHGAGNLVGVFCLPLPSLYTLLVFMNFITCILCSDCMSFGMDRTNKLAYEHESVHVIDQETWIPGEWQEQIYILEWSYRTCCCRCEITWSHIPFIHRLWIREDSILNRRMIRWHFPSWSSPSWLLHSFSNSYYCDWRLWFSTGSRVTELGSSLLTSLKKTTFVSISTRCSSHFDQMF